MRRRNIDTRKFSERRASSGCNSCRKAFSHELEIFQFPGSNKDLEKAAYKVWPDVVYKGQDIVDFILEYDSKIRRKFENNSINLPSDNYYEEEIEYTYMQECYGGYDIKSDTYYMGFDVSYEENDVDYDEEEVPGWVLFKIKNGKFEWVNAGPGLFYTSGYKVAKNMGLADLRLD